MSSTLSGLRTRASSRRGGIAIEYALLVFLCAAAAFGGMMVMGESAASPLAMVGGAVAEADGAMVVSSQAATSGGSDASGHSNNGHGNNVDGVDSSNPAWNKSGGKGGVNPDDDPSGGVDDEKKKASWY